MIYVIGIGIEGASGLGPATLKIIERAGLVAGAKRHLAGLDGLAGRKVAVTGDLARLVRSIKRQLKAAPRKPVVVLATGDPSLFGIADFIIRTFGKRVVKVLPNVSVAQVCFARIKEHSNGLKVVSAHGRKNSIPSITEAVLSNNRTAIFTDPVNTPSKIARALMERGLSGCTVYVCEAVGTDKERITRGTLATVASMRSKALSTMILIKSSGQSRPASPPPQRIPLAPGIPDAEFFHSKGMITKEEIRTVVLSKLRLTSASIVWDIGSGSGSVAVEAARLAPQGRVYTVEKKRSRLADIRRNKSRFDAFNLDVIAGTAPGCLRGKRLPSPEAIFVGGGGSGIAEILRYSATRLKPGGRMVVNAVTIETAYRAFEFFREKGWDKELVMMGLARAKNVGALNMLGAFNPVFIITGTKP